MPEELLGAPVVDLVSEVDSATKKKKKAGRRKRGSSAGSSSSDSINTTIMQIDADADAAIASSQTTLDKGKGRDANFEKRTQATSASPRSSPDRSTSQPKKKARKMEFGPFKLPEASNHGTALSTSATPAFTDDLSSAAVGFDTEAPGLSFPSSDSNIELGYILDDFLFDTSMNPDLCSTPFVKSDEMIYHGDFVPAVLQTPVTEPVNLGLGNGATYVNGTTSTSSSSQSEPSLTESEFLDTVVAAFKADDDLLREFVRQSVTARRAGPSGQPGSSRQCSSVNVDETQDPLAAHQDRPNVDGVIPDTHPSLAYIVPIKVVRSRSSGLELSDSLVDIVLPSERNTLESASSAATPAQCGSPTPDCTSFSSPTPSLTASSKASSSKASTPAPRTPTPRKPAPRTPGPKSTSKRPKNSTRLDKKEHYDGVIRKALDLAIMYYQIHIITRVAFPEAFDKNPAWVEEEKDIIFYCLRRAFKELGLVSVEHITYRLTNLYIFALVVFESRTDIRVCLKTAARSAVLDVFRWHTPNEKGIPAEETKRHKDRVQLEAEAFIKEDNFVKSSGNPQEWYINEVFRLTIYEFLYSDETKLGKMDWETFGKTIPYRTLALVAVAILNAIQEYEEKGSLKAVPFTPKRYFKEYVGHFDAINKVSDNKFYGPIFNTIIGEWASSGSWESSNNLGGPSRVTDPYEGDFCQVELGLIDDTFFPNPPPIFYPGH